MDLSKIKMVVTDMDGTLLNSNHEVSVHFYELFKALKKHKILFVAASGRQYNSIVDKLKAIRDEIIVVSENGAFVKEQDKELLTTPLSKKQVDNILSIVQQNKGMHAALCSKHNAYVSGESEDFITMLSQYYSNFEITDLPHWVDVSSINAHKGYAIEKLMKDYNIKSDELMVFGDYNNDLEMLALAKYSFAMKNAHPNVKEVANYKTSSNDDLGVEKILEKLIDSKN